MEKLIFDSGIKEYQLGNCGVLRVNFSDPNLYARFYKLCDKLPEIEQKMTEEAQGITEGQDVLTLLEKFDGIVKDELDAAFIGNNFRKIMKGVSLMAVAGNGERVVTNLMNALTPVMKSGAESCVSGEVAKAKMNRAQRRASR